ncbi:hypothetical protein [Photobacterium phosphoreum]|uniref:hypothetical protein n=1 Tax=Photobacterium phosphoreum TaxID=659 RepID=UPI001E5A773E|nr:hypothetical protein [Photobacterium phosphoreum]MCD9471050.1 hypothetical protein [Photobacterium phosphoreum]
MMKIKSLYILGCMLLVGCKSGTDDQKINPHPLINKTNIYAAYYAGNFGRAYMLSQAFSENNSDSVIALGSQGQLPFYYKTSEGSQFKVIKQDQDYNKISDIIINNSKGDNNNDLYIDIIGISEGHILTDEALSHLKDVFIVPEGTSFFGIDKGRIDNIISFSKRAKENGVKNVKIILWDSVDIPRLLKSSAEISRLPNHGIEFELFNFMDLSKKVKLLHNNEGLLSSAIYTGAINKSITQGDVFIKNDSFDKNKESVVLLGSYTRNEINTSKTNQIDILKKMENSVDLKKYNIIFKGHPSEVSVNEWIKDNPSLTSASYFKSFPYELWNVIGGGDHKYIYNGVNYNLFLPKPPSEIYSIFSTALYGEDANKIKIILGYNKVKLDNSEYILTSEIDRSAVEDLGEYNRWVDFTKNTNVPFVQAYDWINNIEK